MFLTIVAIFILIITVICIWKTVEYFSMLPDSDPYKNLLAWDVLVMFMLAVAIIIKLAMK